MRRLAIAAGLSAAVALMLLLVERPWVQRATPAEQKPGGGAEAFVFAEDGRDTTTYWLADAQNPSVRKRLAIEPHQAGWSGNASLSPNGRWLAYTTLPPSSADPDHQSELWLLDVKRGGAQRRDTGVDLASFLVWSPDNTSVTFERVAGAGIELWRQPAGRRPAELLQPPATSEVTVPAGYDREDSALVAAQLGPAGTDIVRILSGAVSVLSHGDAGSSRDFAVSPDGTHLAYLSTGRAAGPRAYAAHEVDLVNGSDQTLGRAGAEDVGLAWRPDGSLTIGSVGAGGGLRAGNGDAVFPPIASGFEQPLAWSPAGTRLAVRQFSGASASDPGVARDLLIEPDGSRRSITAVDPVRFVGWVTP